MEDKSFTIVQLSDLHFGAENPALREALKRRLLTVKPNVIVVTGDLADEPNQQLFDEALMYLSELQSCCLSQPATDLTRPQIICVPGNHDFLPGGYLFKSWGYLKSWRQPNYAKTFATIGSDYFFLPEKVWIFGFDSASSGAVGGAGEVRPGELQRFHDRYEQLKTEFGSKFELAFKIGLIHHHPLPVSWEADPKQRWLTLVNSGTFLAGVLHRKINLILHGHEHVQAFSRLHSSLGGSDEAETCIVSLGTTLKKKPKDRNWFNVISLAREGDVAVTSYPGYLQDFEEQGERKSVRSVRQARDSEFVQWRKESGYVYDEVTSITLLDKDGDAQRTVEYNGLEVFRANTDRSFRHILEMPYTSGYIDIPEVCGKAECNIAGIHFAEPKVDRSTPSKALKRTIDWGRELQTGEKISYWCSWFAVNAFAMDEHQFEMKYEDQSGLEFTHIMVNEPVEELLVIVQFPKDFVLKGKPEVRVARHDATTPARNWQRYDTAAHGLYEAGALRYVEPMRIAALRVNRPLKGYSYGIQWRVPPSARRSSGVETLRIKDILRILLKSPRHIRAQRLFTDLLGRVSLIAREAFNFGDWTNELEGTFMVFDIADRRLKVAGAATTYRRNTEICIEHREEMKFTTATFDYGDGIAGRAFKTNECRLYLNLDEDTRQPDYYRELEGQPAHAVILSMPVRSPANPGDAYGVLNFASHDSSCPLGEFAFTAPGSSRELASDVNVGDVLLQMQKRIDDVFYQTLTKGLLPGSDKFNIVGSL